MTDHSAMKLGKAAARLDHRTLRLSNYTATLIPAPFACDLTSKITNLSDMRNKDLGDCTCAAVGHIIQQWTAENGNQVILSDDVIVDLYSKVSGYVPGDDSTDAGAVEIDVLNFWKANGVGGHSLTAYVYIHPQRPQELKNAVFYFGSCYVGVQLPLTAQTQDVWEVGKGDDAIPGSWGGHAIPIVAYDEKYIYCITWGAIKRMTWDFFAKYCDEAYALLSVDWACTDVNALPKPCPTGFDFNALQADLQEITA